MRKRFFHTAAAPRSISSMLGRSYIAIIVAMATPTAIITLTLFLSMAKYNALIDEIGRASALRDMLGSTFLEEIWSIVSGSRTFEEGQQYTMLHQVESGIGLLQKDSEEAARYGEAARRANNTLRSYVDLLHHQIESGSAVRDWESSYREISSVASLTRLMLEQYIYAQMTTISQMNGQIQRLCSLVLVFSLFLLVMVSLFALQAFRQMRDSIYRPILKLEEMTKQITLGDLSARVVEPSPAELVPLTASLNHMAGRLQELIDERVKGRQNLQKAEMRALQAQITPHFVYNTLETIVWLAEQERNEELVEITMAFTDFFRISVNRGKDYVTVEQEKEHVKSYLAIQSVRYSRFMSYRVEIAEELLRFAVLKLLLQPLVENAIYHGLKNKRGKGTITVTGVQNPDATMTFVVEDSGMGMQPERLQQVLENLKRAEISDNMAGFGLYNVNRRIHLYYNRTLEIASEYGKGTRISFTIPCEEKRYD